MHRQSSVSSGVEVRLKQLARFMRGGMVIYVDDMAHVV